MKLVRIDYSVKQRCNLKACSLHHGISLNKYVLITTLLLSNNVEVNPGPSAPCSTRNGSMMDGNLNSAAIEACKRTENGSFKCQKSPENYRQTTPFRLC